MCGQERHTGSTTAHAGRGPPLRLARRRRSADEAAGDVEPQVSAAEGTLRRPRSVPGSPETPSRRAANPLTPVEAVTTPPGSGGVRQHPGQAYPCLSRARARVRLAEACAPPICVRNPPTCANRWDQRRSRSRHVSSLMAPEQAVPDRAALQRGVDAYLPLVRRVVRQLARRLPANVQRDDLAGRRHLRAGRLAPPQRRRRRRGLRVVRPHPHPGRHLRRAARAGLALPARPRPPAGRPGVLRQLRGRRQRRRGRPRPARDDPAEALEWRSLRRALARALPAAPRARAHRGRPPLLRGRPAQGHRRRARA